MSDRVMVAAGRVSAAKRWGKPDLAEAQAELAEAQLERQIRKAIPELTTEGRFRLMTLLAPPTTTPDLEAALWSDDAAEVYRLLTGWSPLL